MNATGYEEIELEDPCSLCEDDEATTTWGMPVCESCAAALTAMDVELKAMEAADPKLKALGDRIRTAEQRLHATQGSRR